MTIPNTKTLRVGQKVTHDKFPSYGVGEIHSFDHVSKSILIYWDGPQMTLRNKRQFLSLVPPTPKGSTVIQFKPGEKVTHTSNPQYGIGEVLSVTALGRGRFDVRVKWPVGYFNEWNRELVHFSDYLKPHKTEDDRLADWEKELLGVPANEAELQLNEELTSYLEGIIEAQVKIVHHNALAISEAELKIKSANLRIDAANKQLDRLKKK